ncbi:MAG: hypothetical protein Q9205_001844 [Flavoplaca limonia]
MSERREAAWRARSRALGRPIHGDPDPDGYSRERRTLYPGVGPDFPGPHHFPDGYSARDGYAAYTAACHKNDASRDAYNERERAHAAELRAIDAQQQRYYQLATGGYFPTAHRELKPLARELADDASGHAEARERLYSHASNIYGTRDGQTTHEGYITNRYRDADRAEVDYREHSKYENDPTSEEVDCYGRPIPHGYKPDTVPFESRPPLAGHYSTQAEATMYTIKPQKPRRGKR